MDNQTFDKSELLSSIAEAVLSLNDLMSSLDEGEINSVPYEESWTAGELFSHVTKSINGIAKAMEKEAQPSPRDPGERIAELKKTFLDLSHKMKSPEFILPAKGPFEKQTAIEELSNALQQLRQSAGNADLATAVKGFPLGDVTKLELLHFILYHTQRHLQQMHKISVALKENNKRASLP